ncbi:MAG: NAD(P)-dependent oxidoreductase [Gemmatimonadota bacterium]|nr:NAD(P)-dependent oxidoreductase [Gemmatimonadota bacterium]
MRVGFLGLGAIGTPMAARVARAHDLAVWNRNGERARAFAASHRARAASTPREAVENAAVIVTCLPTSRDVAALVEGPDGILAGARPGAVLADCTSGDPATSRRLAELLGAHGIGFIDAPVSGGTNGAEAGTLTVMVGGSLRDIERARPVLAAFGSRIEHVGAVGGGHALKAVNNALLAVHIRAFAEGFAALVKAGVPAAKAVEVLNVSSGRSFVSESLVPERVLTGAWPRTFRLALLEKDLGIAVDLAEETGIAAPLLGQAGELFARARAELGEDADYLEMIRLVERESGVEIRA